MLWRHYWHSQTRYLRLAGCGRQPPNRKGAYNPVGGIHPMKWEQNGMLPISQAIPHGTG